MSDPSLNYYIARGTNADRLAFTPSHATPAAGPSQTAIFYETDTGDTYVWDGAAWDKLNTVGGGVAGAPANAEYLVAVANGTLSAERVPTDTSTVAWDFGTAAQAKANVPNDAITYAKIQNVSNTDRLLGRDTAGAGDVEELSVSGGLEFSGGPGLRVADNGITYAKLQDVSATDRLLGRDTAGAGDAEELTVGGGVEFTGSGGIQRSALTGDVTAAAGNNATTIANDAVSDAKLRNSAAVSLIGRSANSSGDPGDIAASADGQVLQRRASALLFSNLGIPIWSRKGSDQSWTSDTALANVTSLSFAVEANSVYLAKFYLFMVGGTTGDLKYDFTVPASATGWHWGNRQETTDTIPDNANINWIATDTFSTTGAIGLHTTITMAIINVLVVTAGASGTVQLRAAQNASSGTASTIKANSCVEATKME